MEYNRTILAPLIERDECASDSNWQPTREAWISDDTDTSLRQWWDAIQNSSEAHGSFANELGKRFGPKMNGFECGIGDIATCTAPGCEGLLDYHKIHGKIKL